MINFRGEETTLSALSKRFDIPISTLHGRYNNGHRGESLVSKKHKGALSKNAATKLTKDDVIAIKRMLALSDKNQAEIAKKFGVSACHISDIKNNKRWAEVTIDLEKEMN